MKKRKYIWEQSEAEIKVRQYENHVHWTKSKTLLQSDKNSSFHVRIFSNEENYLVKWLQSCSISDYKFIKPIKNTIQIGKAILKDSWDQLDTYGAFRS